MRKRHTNIERERERDRTKIITTLELPCTIPSPRNSHHRTYPNLLYRLTCSTAHHSQLQLSQGKLQKQHDGASLGKGLFFLRQIILHRSDVRLRGRLLNAALVHIASASCEHICSSFNRNFYFHCLSSLHALHQQMVKPSKIQPKLQRSQHGCEVTMKPHHPISIVPPKKKHQIHFGPYLLFQALFDVQEFRSDLSDWEKKKNNQCIWVARKACLISG